jgi:3-oxoacyl-[acyl-carrier protein] reductase
VSGRLAGRRALVVGAAGGIGAAVAARLEAEGARTLGADRRPRPGQVAVDVADSASVEAMWQTAGERLGGTPDILVNAAGIARLVPVADMTDADWQETIAVNLSGTFYACRAAARTMAAGGAIVNVASDLGQIGAAALVHYSASKGGVIALTRALARELAPRGIRVNAVAPGAIHTPMLDAFPPDYERTEVAFYPLGRFGEPEEVAAAVAFLASDDASYFVGQVLNPNGGEVMT